MQAKAANKQKGPDFAVAIIGSGFGGLGMAIRLMQEGRKDFVVLEKDTDVGGTWRDNTYPGCACDVPSHLYSFSFERQSSWSRMYPRQSELLTYLRRCADKYEVRSRIRFNSALSEARFDETNNWWEITTASGDRLTARSLVTAMGGLSRPSIPRLPGIEKFQGPAFHSAQWDHQFDFSGKRVAVIGTGASAIQFVPELQKTVKELHLFQRTPPWILPKADRAISRREHWMMKWVPGYMRLFRNLIYWRQEITAVGFTLKPSLMAKAKKFALDYLQRKVADPVLRAKLTPDYEMGCKRILLSNNYLPALCQPNVTLHDTREMTEVTERGILVNGVEQPVDAIIYGTGFRATDVFSPLRIIGRNGVDLNDVWTDTGIEAYYGTTVAGYPNLFMLLGPNTGLGHNSIVFMIESQINYVIKCLDLLRKRRSTTIECLPQAQRDFNTALQNTTRRTIWGSGCKSWYFDANGRNVTLWPGFTFSFWWKMKTVVVKSYRFGS